MPTVPYGTFPPTIFQVRLDGKSRSAGVSDPVALGGHARRGSPTPSLRVGYCMSTVRKVISGGQTGADQGGLEAARLCGLETGGWIPRGFPTLNGPAPELGRRYRLQEHSSPNYPPRTRRNVKESDGTLRLARNFNTPGEICTLKFLRQYGKPHLDIDIDHPPLIEEVRNWPDRHRIRVLNVAGNTDRQAASIFFRGTCSE